VKDVLLKIIVAGGNYMATVMPEQRARELIGQWREGRIQVTIIGDNLNSWAVRTDSIQVMHIMELDQTNQPVGPSPVGFAGSGLVPSRKP